MRKVENKQSDIHPSKAETLPETREQLKKPSRTTQENGRNHLYRKTVLALAGGFICEAS